jgi:DNA-binding MarR family transcriptional regulator
MLRSSLPVPAKTARAARPRPGRAPREDRETRAHPGDHRALRLWLRLLTCTLLIERHVRSRLRARFATTLPRFDLMSQLERHPQGLKMNELSRRMMVTGGNVTGIVDQLVKERLVERLPEAGDRRALRVRLTRAGQTQFGDMAREHEAWIAAILADLTRREHEALLTLLARVKQHALAITEGHGAE